MRIRIDSTFPLWPDPPAEPVTSLDRVVDLLLLIAFLLVLIQV